MSSREGEKMNARIVLFGLDDSLVFELRSVLIEEREAVFSLPFLSLPECLDAVEQTGADLIFCSSDRGQYLPLLDAIGRYRPELPVVVVSRVPEVTDWLDAMEAGASDYCAPPFEPTHVRWILDSTLKHHSAPALHRAAG
jgi:DNA-binding NtrC family response regulator